MRNCRARGQTHDFAAADGPKDWTLGGGIEAMPRANWLARRVPLCRSRHDPQHRRPHRPALPLVVSYDLHMRARTASFGLACKRDAGGPPVAKY
jgi:hypothetical protein